MPQDDSVAYGLPDLVKTLRKVSRGKLKADLRQASRRREIACRHRRRPSEHRDKMQELLSFIEALERFTESLEQEMITHLAQNSATATYFFRFKGTHEVTAAGPIYRLRLAEFRTRARVIACRSGPLRSEPGRHKASAPYLQRGRPLMRKLLYFAALNTVMLKAVPCTSGIGALRPGYAQACVSGGLLAERFSEFSLPLCVIIASTYPTLPKACASSQGGCVNKNLS